MAQSLKELLLYQYRYVIGGGVLIILSIALVAWQLADIPPGFSELEKQSALISANISHMAESFVNLPYHLLQKASLSVFGPTAWGIRLPSAVLGLLLLAALYFLLKRWFKGNIAVMGTVLAATSVYFLMQARVGTPDILYFLWPALLLLAATFTNTIDGNWRNWLWLFTAVAALSLYTPYMLFFVAALLLIAAASRSGRALMAEIDGAAIAISGLTAVILLVPLGYDIYQNPQSVFDYLGTFQAPSLDFILQQLATLATYATGYGAEPGTFYPVLSVPAIALGLYGVYCSARHIGQGRHATVLLWLFIALAILLSAPESPAALLFVPAVLLVIVGLRGFINIWYGLFPRNPYARTAALLPIALLLLVLVGFNYQRYFYGLPRAENVHAVYDSDIMLLQDQFGRLPRTNTLMVVVPPNEERFFGLLEKQYNLVEVVNPDIQGLNYNSENIIIAEPAYDQLPDDTKQTLADREVQLLVDSRSGSEVLRFRSYK